MAQSKKVFQWSFDFAGQPLLPGVQAPSMVEEKAWEVQAAFIRRVDEAVKELSGGGVDLERLAGSFRVIPASPEWVAVQRALAALQTAARFRRPPNGADVDVVRAYTALLEQNGEVIALALVCGVLVGTGHPEATSAPARLLRGLESMTALALGGTHSPLEVLRGAGAAAVAPLPDGLAAPLGTDAPPALGPQTLEPWKRWVKSKHLALLPPAFAPDLAAVRMQAWGIWLHRFRVGATPATDAAPTLPELVCRAAGVTPSALLPPALSTLSLEEWSAILVLSLKSDQDPADPAFVPAWMAVPALQALGLGARAAQLIPMIPGASAGEAMRLFGESILRGSPAALPPEASFLIVRRYSPTRKWMPSTPPRAAVLALTLADLRALVEEVPPPVAQALLSGLGHRVYESDGYEAVQREADELIRLRAKELLTTARLGEPELLRKAEEQDRPGQTPLDRLMALVAPPSPDASMYARLAAANESHLPPGLAAFLAAPRRIARGKLRVEMSTGWLGAGTLRVLGVPMLGTEMDCRYEGQTVIGAVDGRERLTINLGRAQLRADHWPHDGMLSHEGGSTEAGFRLVSDLAQVRLRQRWFYTSRGSLVTRLLRRTYLRPRFDVRIVERAETVWGVEFECRVLGVPVLHMEGDFEGQVRA